MKRKYKPQKIRRKPIATKKSETPHIEQSGDMTDKRDRPFTPDDIIQMQRTLGNQATQRMIKQKTAEPTIQRDDDEPDGLIDLGGGYRGEVGIEGKIKKNAEITKVGTTDKYKVPADAHAFIHDIEDKDNYFVQIPGYVVDQLASDKEETVKKATDDLANKSVDEKKDSSPIKGTVKKSKVSAHKGQLKHREVTEPLFPKGGAKPEHIEQRGLGNCYFLSALGSVASQYPGYLENMMTDNGKTVTVRFFRKGDDNSLTAENVTVKKSVVKKTNFFNTRGKGLYSATHVPWPALATKAYAAWTGHAKAALPGFGGTYEGTAGGKSDVVFEHVLGKSSSKADISKGLVSQMSSDVPESERNLIPPGHPKLPKVEVWDSKAWNRFRIYVSKQFADVFSGYLQDQEDATTEDKFKAYIKEKVTDPMGVQLSDLTFEFNKWGSNAYVPAELILTKMVAGLGEGDATKWAKWMKEGGGRKVLDDKKVGKATGVIDRTQFSGYLGEAGLSKTGKEAMMEFAKTTVIGTPDDINYRPQDMALANKIKNHIASGGMVNASTPDFGKKGGGQSGGEDTETVPGIAGTHAYTVIGIADPDDQGRILLTMRNPWGSSGIEYSEDYTARKEIDDGNGIFKLELSDFVRYYEDLQYSAAIEKGYDPTQIKDKSDESDE